MKSDNDSGYERNAFKTVHKAVHGTVKTSIIFIKHSITRYYYRTADYDIMVII